MWTPTTEKLPEIGQNVLVCTSTGNYEVAKIFIGDDKTDPETYGKPLWEWVDDYDLPLEWAKAWCTFEPYTE